MSKCKILNWIEEEFDLDISDICHNGIFVDCGDKSEECDKVVTAVSPTINVIQKAVDEGANILITHHALWISSADVVLTGINMKKVELLINAGITLVSMHAPIDSHEDFSHSVVAAKKSGLSDIKRIQIRGAYAVEGTFNGNIENLKSNLSEIYGCKGIHSISRHEPGRVCILSGGGSKFFHNVIAMGYDTFITGSADEPNWNDSQDLNKNFLSFGHYSTEKCGMIEIGETIANKFGCEHVFIEESNPF